MSPRDQLLTASYLLETNRSDARQPVVLAAAERRTSTERGPTSRLVAALPARAGSKLSQTISHCCVATSEGTWKANGSHHALTRTRKSSSSIGVPSLPTSGSVAPSMNNAMLRASGSAQSALVIGAPVGVNQPSSDASLPVR